MGGGSYSPSAVYKDRSDSADKGFTYASFTDAARSGKTTRLHALMNPALGGIRVCDDQADGTKSWPITIYTDVTGSNRENAEAIFEQMPKLMPLLLERNWVPGHPNVQFGAIGDATCDKVPLQIGQFELDGIKLDDELTHLYLEGGGGGGSQESYELAMWQLVYGNQLKAWERGQKGRLIMIFDEAPYNEVSTRFLTDIYHMTAFSGDLAGDDTGLTESQRKPTSISLPQSNISLRQIAQELQAKYDADFIICGNSGYYDAESTLPVWRGLFGEQRIHKLKDPNDIVGMIAALLGAGNGIDKADIHTGLSSLDLTSKALVSIDAAVAKRSLVASGTQVGSSKMRRIT